MKGLIVYDTGGIYPNEAGQIIESFDTLLKVLLPNEEARKAYKALMEKELAAIISEIGIDASICYGFQRKAKSE